MATQHRVNRLRQSLLREFSDIVRKLKDPRIRFVNVVDAEITSDLRHATMYYNVLGSEQDRAEAAQALESAVGFIRREVAQRIDLRYAPDVRVVYDETSERAARLTALIDSLKVPAAAGEAGAVAEDDPEGADDDGDED
ncbi:MAG: 30S ribosome-binding factor RbfA [Gemmatimonadota bacterium]